MKGSKPVGVFFSEDEFEKFIEQMQIQFEHEERKKRQPPKSFDDLLK
ncbi:MAG: hypothetical protein U9Q15_02135 [Patescibacteria group bacterium]|nr:hypothetical protein [Patescibacteria group bacterium]